MISFQQKAKRKYKDWDLHYKLKIPIVRKPGKHREFQKYIFKAWTDREFSTGVAKKESNQTFLHHCLASSIHAAIWKYAIPIYALFIQFNMYLLFHLCVSFSLNGVKLVSVPSEECANVRDFLAVWVWKFDDFVSSYGRSGSGNFMIR